MGVSGPPIGPPIEDLAESSDAEPIDGLGSLVKPRVRIGSRRRLAICFGIIVVALGALAWRGLTNATEYFKTADEAVAARAQLGTKNFRIEGTVQPGVRQDGQLVTFVIENNGVSVPVVQQGEPPQLFAPGVPVVLDGHFASPSSATFDSNLIMVKHSDSYTAAHPDRVTTVPEPSSTP